MNKAELIAEQLANAGEVKRQYGSAIVLVSLYGAVGDGSANDTAAIQNALNAADNKLLVFDAGKTYRVNSKLTLPKGCVIFGNGATINMYLSGNVEGLVLNDNCRIYDLTVNCYEVVAATGNGQMQCPIVIGNYDNGTGNDNIELHNLTLSAQRTGGNCLSIIGDSHNILVDNVTFPASSNTDGSILIHWGNGANPSAGTTHPHDIHIRNVKAAAQTSTSVDQAFITVSGAYNIKVENVEVEEVGRNLIMIVAGDFGFEYAPAAVKPLAMKNITIQNCISRLSHKYGVNIDSKAPQAPGAPVYETNIMIKGVVSIGNGTSTVGNGFNLANCKGVTIEDCIITKHLNGFGTVENVKEVTVLRGRWFNNYYDGFSLANGTTAPEDITIRDAIIYDNGFGGTGSSRTGVEAFNCKRPRLIGNKFGNRAAENNQFYSVYLDSLVTDAEVRDNHTFNVKAAGTAYRLGGSSEYGVVKVSNNNSADAAVVNVHAGVSPIPVVVKPDGTRILFGDAIPTVGTWKRGDEVQYQTLLASGKRGAVCTAAGTPGTWKTWGAIDA